jgi:hypothetical protein
MRRFTTLAVAGVLAVLGFTVSAAPASASVVASVWATSDATGTSINLVDNVLNTCLPIGINAQSGFLHYTTRTVRLYDNLGDCINGGSAFTFSGYYVLESFSTKMAYKVS